MQSGSSPHSRSAHAFNRSRRNETGMWADIVVFDPATIRDLATFEKPNQLSEGMEYVLVNGVPVMTIKAR